MIESNDNNTPKPLHEIDNMEQNELESVSPFVNKFGEFE
jgi:hypothetical protein